MSDWLQLLSEGQMYSVVRAIILLASGLIVGKLLGSITQRLLKDKFSEHQLKLTRRIVFYLILGLFIASALRELGFSLTTLLGAAGIFSVAIGFASQTSASNFISGLFLMAEKPFAIGDAIQVGSTTGEVLSIDALSVKIRTFDNRYVRIPNETLLKSETITLTKFPIRRIDLPIGVAYKENVSKVREVLFDVAARNPLCLDEPKPLLLFLNFGESALEFQLSVWAKRQNFLELKNSILEEIKMRFDSEGIEIPFPHRTIYTGAITEPFPVHISDNRDSKA